MVMFDTLNRRHLPPYGCDWVHAPNFSRLASRTVTFDNSYICSMPCIPARRDLHTGRPNFLHRSWGPIEPYDDSMPQMLREAGIHSALITDHAHYFEEGGGTYHNRYSSWQFYRGQEGDPCWGQAAPEPPVNMASKNALRAVYPEQDRVNRKFMMTEQDQPQAKTFAGGLDFIERNASSENWFLQIETFDPHEPFFTQRHYQDLYRDRIGYRSETPHADWPAYGHSDLPTEVNEQINGHYAALVTMCDRHLGDVLDAMDRHKLWDDTMLIVWTDHGFLLGEHDLWGKGKTPFYDQVAHTPFFVWDPRCGKRGERRGSLVQPSIDLAPTILDFFGLNATPDMTGRNLRESIATDQPVREVAVFGIHGGFLNVTDGRYVFFQPPLTEGGECYEYTLMPAHMHALFSVEELRDTELTGPFRFSKGLRLLKTVKQNPRDAAYCEFDVYSRMNFEMRPTVFDLREDPEQSTPVNRPDVINRFKAAAAEILQTADAPPELYLRCIQYSPRCDPKGKCPALSNKEISC